MPYIGQKVMFRPHEPNRRVGETPRLLTGVISAVWSDICVNIGYLDEHGAALNCTSVWYLPDGSTDADVTGRFCYPTYDKALDSKAIEGESQQPAPRKLKPGDIVKLNGAESRSPVMTVVGDDPDRIHYLECSYWNDDHNRFYFESFHKDALVLQVKAEPLPAEGVSASNLLECAYGVGEQVKGSCESFVGQLNTADMRGALTKHLVAMTAGCQVGENLKGTRVRSLVPTTTSASVLKGAVRIGLELAELEKARGSDGRLLGCLRMLIEELGAHVVLED